MDEVTVLSPATVSNIVCGFDCLGFALSEPRDQLTVRIIDERTIRIRNEDEFQLTCEPTANVAGIALQALIDDAVIDHGFEIVSRKTIKPGSGIGSSAASAAGAVIGADLLLNTNYRKDQLVSFAMKGEAFASGAVHADNLAPCIFGGFALVRSVEPLDIVQLQYPPLYATVIHPQIEIKTSEARAMLPTQIPLKQAVKQWSNLGALVSALGNGDHELIRRSLEDVIIEPVRKSLIPKFDALKTTSIEAGALGGGISGSGPSVFMLSASKEVACNVETAMRDVYDRTGIQYKTYVSEIDREGVRYA